MGKKKNTAESIKAAGGAFSLRTLNPVKSIVARGCFIALAGVFITLIAAYLTTVPGARSALIDQAENNMLDLSQSYTKILEARIGAVNDTAEYMSTDSDIYSCLLQGSEVSLVTLSLKNYIKKNPAFLSAAIYDKDGKFLTASDKEYASDDNPYYINAALSLQKNMQSDYINVGGEPCIICAVPLINAGNLFGCAAITVPVKTFTSELASVKLQNTDSSFAYLITPRGYFLYHPDASYIGQIAGEQVIRDLIAQGNVASAIAGFDCEGDKLAGLATSTMNGYTLVIQADKDELLQPVSSTVFKSIILSVIVVLIVSVLAFLGIYVFLHPIATMTKEITNISSLNFTSIKAIDKLTKEQTEIGTMAKEIKKMHDNIKNVISNLNDVTANINFGSSALSDIAASLTDCSSENSAVSEQLASGMEETTNAVGSITGEIDTIQNRTVEINRQSRNSIQLSKTIMDRAENAKKSAVEAANTTRELYKEVSEEAHLALKRSKAVSKINDLTQNILDIADQTSLLALNATIEAARSGKYGKGFAVVANEISNLAEQSSETVNNIMAIVNEVIAAVDNIDACLTKTLNLIDTSIMNDYDNFTEISVNYHEDAQSFQDTLMGITNSLKGLEIATNDIAQAVVGINATMTESSNGVATIADRSTDVVQLSGDTYNQVKRNAEMADTLQGIVEQFKL